MGSRAGCAPSGVAAEKSRCLFWSRLGLPQLSFNGPEARERPGPSASQQGEGNGECGGGGEALSPWVGRSEVRPRCLRKRRLRPTSL
jgi:hypothetical protein